MSNLRAGPPPPPWEGSSPLPVAPPPAAAELEAAVSLLKQWTSALSSIGKVAEPLVASRLGAAVGSLNGLDGIALGARLSAIQQRLQAWAALESVGRRRRLAAELKALCEARGLPLRLVGKEPLELRIPPVAVLLRVDQDLAELHFARQPLETTSAEAGAILAARERAVMELEGEDWQPTVFLRLLLAAWRRADGKGWTDLALVLPELVLLQQNERFRREPTAKNFQPYSRARFCYDLWRLRRDRCLAVDGWRLSLGPATGGSTSDKKRVFWLEDGDGEGQWYLSIRFLIEGDNHE